MWALAQFFGEEFQEYKTDKRKKFNKELALR